MIADESLLLFSQTKCELFHISQRMALSYLVGSTGHFGQERGTNKTATYSNQKDSVILLTEIEAILMVELMANTFANRAKEGPGGYSAATFHVKWVLYSIRCLLTHTGNQALFASTMGPRLNALLMKALSEYSVKNNSTVDAEAAEYAAFSLYLQSNYGFNDRFLPAVYGNQDNIKGTGSLAAKVLTSYIHMESITPAGRHAADQLLLRLRYLDFKGSVSDLAHPPMLVVKDFSFDEVLLKKADSILVEKRSHGSRPRDDIFDRPILRSRVPKKGEAGRAPWENRSIRVFPSGKFAFFPVMRVLIECSMKPHYSLLLFSTHAHTALLAVQELSFGSSRVRHMDAIDDIMVANNISNSANGDKTESYNYAWSWQDQADENQKNLMERQRSDGDSLSIYDNASGQQSPASDGPMTIFGLTCGPVCAKDTTK
jgi:hypothetical protein